MPNPLLASTYDPESSEDTFFTNEFEAWIIKCSAVPTRAAAVELAQRVMGGEYTHVEEVRGRVEWREPDGWWFSIDDAGPLEAWEVTEA